MLKEIIHKNRSYRRFDQNHTIRMETLRELVDLARHSASGANLQPLKYFLSCDPMNNSRIFATLAWAGYLKDWPGPGEGERPSAYIVMFGDTRVSKNYAVDEGIACQSILLGAVEKGLGGCIIATIKKDALRKELGVPDYLEISLVIAIGKPNETVKIEYIDATGDIKYWRDEKSVHHVPKRKLEDIIIPDF
jgi:nitroreductase